MSSDEEERRGAMCDSSVTEGASGAKIVRLTTINRRRRGVVNLASASVSVPLLQRQLTPIFAETEGAPEEQAIVNIADLDIAGSLLGAIGSGDKGRAEGDGKRREDDEDWVTVSRSPATISRSNSRAVSGDQDRPDIDGMADVSFNADVDTEIIDVDFDAYIDIITDSFKDSAEF